MKKIIDKVMAYFGYYPQKTLYDLIVEKAPARKKPAVRKATTRKPAVKK
jgi:hypothetical protein